jgi:predicted RND superfamily exporter protein
MNKALTFILALALLLALAEVKGCFKVNKPTLEVKKEAVKHQIDTITKLVEVQKTRYKELKGETDTIYQNIYLIASDSAKAKLNELRNSIVSERAEADSIIQNDSLTIQMQQVLMDFDKQEIDSLKKQNRKQRLKSFFRGAGVGAAIVSGVVIYKSIVK